MGGSGGHFFGGTSNPEDIRNSIRGEEERAKDQVFESTVAGALGELLSDYNRRDTRSVSELLNQIKDALAENIEGSVDSVFGGSVRKHTAVDGISDVDSLLILKDAELQEMSPQQVLDYCEHTLRSAFPGYDIDRGKLAVTMSRQDLELQLLPAIKDEKGVKIASAAGAAWSRIKPESFFNQLTRSNDRCSGKLVPTIKLIKVINQTFPENIRLTGYHIESLAIEAFRGYSGPLNPKAMLRHFFEDSTSRVLKPITDRTGQSVHVDEYLGVANGQKRKLVAGALDRVVREMKNADATRSLQQWMSIVGEE